MAGQKNDSRDDSLLSRAQNIQPIEKTYKGEYSKK